MRSVVLWLVPIVCGAVLWPARVPPLGAQTRDPIALSGQVTSAEEGPMEGVLVSAKKAGSTITITVVTDAQGRYRFPASRLEPGEYALRIRAVGYDLERAATATVDRGRRPTTADLKLQKTRDLAAQLTNAEWLASFPGTDAAEGDRSAAARTATRSNGSSRSRHDADGFDGGHRADGDLSAARRSR